MWGLRTDSFNEENRSFLVYVPPRPLAVSRFVFKENILFYFCIYCKGNWIRGTLKVGNEMQKEELSAMHSFEQALLATQGGKQLIRMWLALGSWMRSLHPSHRTARKERETELKLSSGPGNQPWSLASPVTCLPGKGLFPWAVMPQLGLCGGRLGEGPSAHQIKGTLAGAKGVRTPARGATWASASFCLQPHSFNPMVYLVSREAY